MAGQGATLLSKWSGDRYGYFCRSLIVALLMICSLNLAADEIRVAVASNFSVAMKEIAARFERKTGHRVLLSFGSTGKHYAQIKQSAPFDVFFAADERAVANLLEQGNAVAGSDFNYAQGKLVLWGPSSEHQGDGAGLLKEGTFRYLAIANPRLAPYGKAAKGALVCLGAWQDLQRKLVRGENISQAYQFVLSGNAEFGLVAESQIVHKKQAEQQQGYRWSVPQHCYSPILQRAVVINSTPVAEQFMAYVKSPKVKQLIAAYGYSLP